MCIRDSIYPIQNITSGNIELSQSAGAHRLKLKSSVNKDDEISIKASTRECLKNGLSLIHILSKSSEVEVSTKLIEVIPAVYSLVTETLPVPERLQIAAVVYKLSLIHIW